MAFSVKKCTEKSSSLKVYMPNFGLSPRLRMRYNFWWQVPRRGGREAEGGGLLNRCTSQNLYRGFESPPLRHVN